MEKVDDRKSLPAGICLVIGCLLLSAACFLAFDYLDLREVPEDGEPLITAVWLLSTVVQLLGCCGLGYLVARKRAPASGKGSLLLKGLKWGGFGALMVYYLVPKYRWWLSTAIMQWHTVDENANIWTVSPLQKFFLVRMVDVWPVTAFALCGVVYHAVVTAKKNGADQKTSVCLTHGLLALFLVALAFCVPK